MLYKPNSIRLAPPFLLARALSLCLLSSLFLSLLSVLVLVLELAQRRSFSTGFSPLLGTMLSGDIPPNQTIYIKNLNEKVKKEGDPF